MKVVHMVACMLLWVGGLNWGLVGLFNYNLVSTFLGSGTMLERLVYILVGLSTVYICITHKSDCKTCSK